MTTSLSTIFFLSDIGRGLREAFFMFWETLWALVLGFTLSGIVQAFVSKDQMRAKLGSHRPAAVARASWYGMVSSSCSYAASAMAKSLFAKGADFTSSMVFMVASTNLVVELGLVMLVLLGWQFAVAEFVGGPVMIILLALCGSWVFTPPLLQRARERIRRATPASHDHHAMSISSADGDEELEASPSGARFTSPAAWSDASGYAVADATMLRRELVIGYVVAGFLAALVPSRAWNALFVHGHGFWTSVENAFVGPLIAVVSWVCSIGNVPLAAALWAGGISFGGVIAFIFADLIAMPLILIYRKLYGGPLTLRLVTLFYAIMVVAGLATQEIFRVLGAVPSRRTFRVSAAHFEWNYTTYLDLVFIALALVVWWMAKNRERFGGGSGYATDPVCGMQVRTSDAPAHLRYDDRDVFFCSDHCRERFESSPSRFAAQAPHTARAAGPDAGDDPTSVDPVCGMTVSRQSAPAQRVQGGVDFYFCSTGCAVRFDDSLQDPGTLGSDLGS